MRVRTPSVHQWLMFTASHVIAVQECERKRSMIGGRRTTETVVLLTKVQNE